MTKEEAESLLGQQSTGTNAPIQFGPTAAAQVQRLPTIAPQPRAPSIAGRPSQESSRQKFIAEHQDPEEPFSSIDLDTGASPWERLMLEFRRSKDNKVKYLQDKYGADNIRMTPDSELFIKIPDADHPGKTKELLVSPHNKLTASDFLALSMVMPEVGGWIAAEKLGSKVIPFLGKKGILPAAGRLGAGALGSEATGAITKDLPANIYDFGKLNLGEMAEGRGEQAVADIGVGAVGNVAKKAVEVARSPFWPLRSEEAKLGEEGRKYFQERFGHDVPFSVGEKTGNRFMMRSEAFVEKEPGGSGPIRKLKIKAEAALRDLQRLMMGNRPGLDEEIGEKAIAEIKAQVEPILQDEAGKRKALQTAAQGSIDSIVNGLTTPSKELYHGKLGSDVRQAIIGKRNEAKAEADVLYDAVRNAPGGSGKVFDGTSLQRRFEDILKKIPSAEVSVPTAVLNQYGQPVMTRMDKILEKWPPDKLLARLREITRLKDPRFALTDLQQMRRDIYDDIGRGEGKPELGVHYLNEIGKAITAEIKSSINGLPSGQLKTALQAADKHYREKVVPFNRLGLTELFRASNEVGSISDHQVVSHLMSGDNAYRNWNLVKETLGATSPEFMRVKRAVVDNILEHSKDLGSTLLDAKSFIKNLGAFSKDKRYREIADEIFAGKEADLIENAKLLNFAEGDKVDAADIQKLLASPHPTSGMLRTLIEAQRKKDELFKNSIIGAIRGQSIDEQTLKPIEFVRRLLKNDSFSVKDTAEVMKLIQGNPLLVDELRAKTLDKVFRDSAREATAADLPKLIKDDATHILSGVSLGKALKDQTFKEKLKILLGPVGYEDLNSYVKLTAPLEEKEEAYVAAGGLVSGSRVAQLEKSIEGKGGLLRFANNVVRSFVFSWLLSNKASRWYFGEAPGVNMLSRAWNAYAPMELEATRKLLIETLSSPPFLQAVAKEFPDASGARFVNNLRSAMIKSIREDERKFAPDKPKPPTTFPYKGSDWEKALGAQVPTPGTNQPSRLSIPASATAATTPSRLTPSAAALPSPVPALGERLQLSSPGSNEVIRFTRDGRRAVFDPQTKKFLRYADDNAK